MKISNKTVVTHNAHCYEYISEIRNLLTGEIAVLCKDKNGESFFCSKLDWDELVKKYAEAQKKAEQISLQAKTVKVDDGSNERKPFNKYATPQEKIELFKSLFIGRKDVFAKRYYNTKTGQGGYVPVCHNEWQYGVCDKKKYKCSVCPNAAFAHITDRDIFLHLKGDDGFCRDVMGVYPLMPENMTIFLAIDFDDENWQEDVGIVRDTCKRYDIPCSVERSRSGNGAHLWIFFDEAVSARDARRLGSCLLTKAMEQRHELKFASYDRMFPNQDTMPKGGFGNLIALPLQGQARKKGNSEFVDESFFLYPDQWEYLSGIEKVSNIRLQSLISELNGSAELGELITDDEKPWKQSVIPELSQDDFPTTVNITKANMLYIEKKGISEKALNKLKRTAAFKNPDFYRSQAMRLPVFNKPRIIDCSEETERYLCLPRGCEEEIKAVLDSVNAAYSFVDERIAGKEIKVSFNGTLRPQQQDAADALFSNNIGVLSATTAFGKTVTAAYLIAQRKVNTLILVHSSALLEQWEKSLSEFLIFEEEQEELPKKRGRRKKLSNIGKLGAGKNTLNGNIDIAIMQSVVKGDEVKPFVKDYGMVIVDECHHVSAFSFEKVLKAVSAKNVYGLTATAIRQDGHQPIIFMQCGPIRYKADALSQMMENMIPRTVIPRFTEFRTANQDINYTELCSVLCADEMRNSQIIEDVLIEYSKGKNIIILTERTEHAELIYSALDGKCRNLFMLSGQDGAKDKRLKLEAVRAVPQDENLVIVAIGKYIGEGFDEPRLDTLFLAMPVSWKGRLSQYAGRLHRNCEGKKEIYVYDYVDLFVPTLDRMYRKRMKGYSELGYTFGGSDTSESDLIYDNKSYLKKLEQDIASGVSEITICSPKVDERMLMGLVRKLPESVSLTLITSITEMLPTELPANVSVLRQDRVFQKYTVIDDRIVWYGDISPVCKSYADASVLRLVNSSLAGRLTEIRL